VLERDGAVCGFAAARAANGTTVVGPAVAPDLDDARTLIADVAARAEGPVRLDIDHRHADLLAWAAERGVAAGEEVALMVRGDAVLPGDRARLMLPMTLAVG
jgi:Acetyltransferase (GNAT) domain